MTNLVWFTTNLRVKDNKVLFEACKEKHVIAVYCLDPRQFKEGDFGFCKTGKFRAKFLIETITDLKKQLAELNISLLVFIDKPENCIPKIVKEYGVHAVYFQNEWTRDEVEVITNAKKQLGNQVEMHGYYDQFLFHPDTIPYSSYHNLPDVFTSFRKKCEKYAKVALPYPSPEPKSPDNIIENATKIPILSDLGHANFEVDNRTAFPFKGGETAALERLQNYFWETKKLQVYKKTRNGLVGTDYSSKFSPWLANGSISARTIYKEVKVFEKEIIKNQDTYWLVFELLWRDYFKYVSLKYRDRIFYLDGILKANYEWSFDQQKLQNWINGETPEPFVNANMIELKNTGWMSNRGRQNVASYWAKHLEQDWRYGAAYFESMLLDYDVHSNWCNWMYNSGVGNDPRNRTFNIKSQAERYDANKKFQNLWLQQTLFS